MFIVNYHNVLDHALDPFDRRSLRIPVDEFRAEMRCLTQQFHPVALDTLLDMARQGDIDSRAVAVTFDDGYTGVLRHALPVMRELDMVGTVFVITDALRDGPGTLRHHDELEMAFRLTTAPVLRLGSFGFPDQPLTTDLERMGCLLEVKRHLKAVRDDLRRLAHTVILERLGVTPEQCRRSALADRHEMLGVDGLLRLCADGWTIGSHSRSHRTLAHLGAEELRSEVTGSREALEQALGVTVTHFAYPYGGADHIGDEAPGVVAASGYRSGFTAQPGAVAADTDWFRIPRVSFDELVGMTS